MNTATFSNNLVPRVLSLESLLLKVAYYAEITTVGGQISTPQGSNILLNQWANGIDAVVSEIVGGQPNFEDSGLDATLDVNGNYTISGTLPSDPTALIYYLTISLKDYGNLDINKVIEQVSLTAEATTESTPIQLKAISQLDQTITTATDGIVPVPEVIQETYGITIDSNGHINFNTSGFYRIQIQLNISNTNNTNIDTWAEYYNGSTWVNLDDSGNVKDSGNSGIGNFIVETTLYIQDPLTIRLKARTITGSALLKYDTADGGIGVPSCTYIAYKLNPTVKGILQQTNDITEPFVIGSESNGNYSSWDEKGQLRRYGEAIQWDDLTNSLIARRLESTNGRLQYNYAENTITMQDGGSINNTNDTLIFNMQKPHAMIPDGEMRLHIHWEQISTDNVQFTLRYRIQSNNELKDTVWTDLIINSNTNNAFTYPGAGTFNQITKLVDLDLSAYALSSTVQFKLARTDNNGADIEAIFVDAHIPRDSQGSNEEFVKY